MERFPASLARAMEAASRGGQLGAEPAERTKRTKAGCIYFAMAGQYIKIGWTTCPEQRRKEIQTGSPHLVLILHTIEEKTKADERMLHARFKKYRRQGEWFSLKGELLEYVSSFMGWAWPPRGGSPRCPAYWKRKREQDANVAELTALIGKP